MLNIPQYPVLMELLPNERRKNVSTEICKSVVATKTYLVSESICIKLIKFLTPLFSTLDTTDTELEMLGKVLHQIETAKFQENLKMIKIFEENFDKKDRSHLQLVYPILIHRVISLVKRTTLIRSEGLDEQQIIKNYANLDKAVYLDPESISKYTFDIENDLAIDLNQVVTYLYSLIKEIEIEHPLQALQLWLDIMLVINDYGCLEENEELIYNCVTRIMTIYENDIGHAKTRSNYFYKILGYFGNLTNYSEDFLEQIFMHLKSGISLLLSREEQARAVLAMSNLFIGHNNERVKDCIQRSWELVRMSMKYEEGGLKVLVKILDSIISYVDKGLSEFSVDEVEVCIQMIDKNIDEIKDRKDFIREVQEYKQRVLAYWRKHAKSEDLLTALNK